MAIRCTLFLTALIAVAASCCNAKVSPQKMRKDFEKLNKYLENHIDTDDPKMNMAKAEQLLDKKSSKCTLFGSTMVDTLKLLSKFSTIPEHEELCNQVEGVRLMEEIDFVLASEFKTQLANYRRSRVDKIVEYYAFENMLRCKFNSDFLKLEYSFKQLAYEEINRQLIISLPKIKDVETNMAKAREILNGLDSKSALANALEQFLMLDSIVREKTCDDEDYLIILKNYLALRGRAKRERSDDQLENRVDNIFKFLASKYEAQCLPIVRKRVVSKLLKLNQDTYRKVLGLTSSFYLPQSDYTQMIESVNQKEVSENFTIPLMEKYAEELISNAIHNTIRLSYIIRLDPNRLYGYLKAVGSPESRLFSKILDENEGKHAFNEAKVKMLLDRYLFNPCSEYLKLYERHMEVEEYITIINENHFRSNLDEFVSDLPYHMVNAGYEACQLIISHKFMFDIV